MVAILPALPNGSTLAGFRCYASMQYGLPHPTNRSAVGGSQEFKCYSYRGYCATDFTVSDRNMDTLDELGGMIDTAQA